jgi:hypothetical protein
MQDKYAILDGEAAKELTALYTTEELKARPIGRYKDSFYIYWYEEWRRLYHDSDDSAVSPSDVGLTAFETGGLADFTGPAWLDGTKSHPELVLNQRDTANFIQLKDILAEIMDRSSGQSTKSSSGDNYFDIEINVESLENDYDVEQLAGKIRSMIYDDASYRNVNAINKIR